MKIYEKVYEENKKLDKMFDTTFLDREMYKKNKLELLVEIGELANETKFFKYWSSKKMDIELVKGEFADCVIMSFYFFNILNISLDEEFKEITNDYDKVDIFGRLYQLASDFYLHDNKEIIKEFFATLIKLGHMIGFTDSDIIDLSLNKITRDMKRFEENY